MVPGEKVAKDNQSPCNSNIIISPSLGGNVIDCKQGSFEDVKNISRCKKAEQL